MHRLFAIDHLVCEICSHAERSELAVLARVSSTLFRIAVSHLYKDVELRDALAPLGHPIEKHGYMEFANSPTDEAFERLLKYTPYVRDLGFSDIIYDLIALEAIRKSASEGIPYLFPNTRSLQWFSMVNTPECVEIATGLISPKIDRLWLQINDDGIFDHISPLITTRLPVLYSLGISCSRDETSTESSLIKSLQEIFPIFAQTLMSVSISPSFNTPSMIECLSKMPNLCNLTIGEYSTSEIERSETCGEGERFPSLCSFSFDGAIQSFYDMFANPVSSLTYLSISRSETTTPDDVGEFISFIVSTFPNIQCLVVSFPDGSLSGSKLSNWPVVPWRSIQAISHCKELHALTLEFIRISVSLEELTEFLKSRTMTYLDMLTSDPLHLQDMLLYAQHCPDLEHLTIHLNDCVGFRIEDLPDDIPTFSSIESIDVAFDGDISKSSSRLFAEFLYRICDKRVPMLWSLDKNFKDYILESLVDLYIEEECRTGKPMSNEIKRFVENNREK